MFDFRFLRAAPVFLLVCSALAQDAAAVFAKAPADVDEALRVRVAKFYQEQIDGHPRLAEKIVADDSKDFFYNMAKPKFLSFEIRDITYSENFTKAKVTMVMEMYVPIAFFGGKPMKVPGPTFWKVETGQWCWYVDPAVMNITPWGKMTTSGSPSSGAASPDLNSVPTPEALAKLVKPDKRIASLRATANSSDQIKIHNGMQGSIRIELHPRASVRGLEIKADRSEIPAGEDALVSFRYVKEGYPPRTVNVDIAVEPTNQLIQCQVIFNP
jgi:hypothetical protein